MIKSEVTWILHTHAYSYIPLWYLLEWIWFCFNYFSTPFFSALFSHFYGEDERVWYFRKTFWKSQTRSRYWRVSVYRACLGSPHFLKPVLMALALLKSTKVLNFLGEKTGQLCRKVISEYDPQFSKLGFWYRVIVLIGCNISRPVSSRWTVAWFFAILE